MKKRILSDVMALCLLLTLLPASTLAADEATGESEPVISQDGADTPEVPAEENEQSGTPGEPPQELVPAPVPPANNSLTAEEAPVVLAETEPQEGTAIYVDGADANDENGDGTHDNPYATLAKAVDAALDGDTIYLLSNLEIGSLAFIDKKAITIDGQGHTVTRADTFEQKNDGRGGYNPAMIEVANGAELTLLHITLDDALKTAEENLAFLEQPTGGGDKNNETKVQDAIIAAYMNGGTIILGYGATL